MEVKSKELFNNKRLFLVAGAIAVLSMAGVLLGTVAFSPTTSMKGLACPVPLCRTLYFNVDNSTGSGVGGANVSWTINGGHHSEITPSNGIIEAGFYNNPATVYWTVTYPNHACHVKGTTYLNTGYSPSIVVVCGSSVQAGP